MSREFLNWFFNEKKLQCGNCWLIAMGAMWEGWKASRSELLKNHQPVAYLVEFSEAVTDDYSKQIKIVELEKPTGHYEECSTPLYSILSEIKND